eukprot:TRINITY_DN13248_c0_g1_i1.p1 TRINITY_DN13248_c0_g1~~TRINITY_DN13248_c0_g1_i1.p1  ORF type:complete len:254 (-),score=38.35 TRINITY_DN13248_c0_g1_i1:112-873(-)
MFSLGACRTGVFVELSQSIDGLDLCEASKSEWSYDDFFDRAQLTNTELAQTFWDLIYPQLSTGLEHSDTRRVSTGPLQYHVTKTMVRFASQLVSNKWAQRQDPRARIDQLPKIMRNIQIDRPDILDLSRCFLGGRDLKYIPRTCEVLVLRYNFLQVSDAAAVLELLPQVRFLDITLNEIATAAFLQTLPVDALERLIFVPNLWLRDAGWRHNFTSVQLDVIDRAHREYYQFFTANFPESVLPLWAKRSGSCPM